MNTNLNLGPVNDHLVGIFLKEMVRRALNAIRAKRQLFEITIKEGYSGKMDDVLTSADTRAQELYLRSIQECFPDVGIISEEDNFNVPPKNGCTATITVDPLDGTKAFVRRQSHGIGSMIAMVQDGEVISAYIGDVNTCEIYGYRPGSEKVHRITEFNASETLNYEKKPITEQFVLMRDRSKEYSQASWDLADRFKGAVIDGGSIGIWLARLWKREVGAAILAPAWETPWDSNPVIGISQRLGYKFLKPSNTGWEEWTPGNMLEKYRRDHDLLVIHQDDVADLLGDQ